MQVLRVSYFVRNVGEHQTGLAGSATGQKSMALAEFGQMLVLEIKYKAILQSWFSCLTKVFMGFLALNLPISALPLLPHVQNSVFPAAGQVLSSSALWWVIELHSACWMVCEGKSVWVRYLKHSTLGTDWLLLYTKDNIHHSVAGENPPPCKRF